MLILYISKVITSNIEIMTNLKCFENKFKKITHKSKDCFLLLRNKFHINKLINHHTLLEAGDHKSIQIRVVEVFRAIREVEVIASDLIDYFFNVKSMSIRQVCNAANLGSTAVMNLHCLSYLTEEEMEYFLSGAIPKTMFYRMSAVPRPEQRRVILLDYLKKNISTKHSHFNSERAKYELT